MNSAVFWHFIFVRLVIAVSMAGLGSALAISFKKISHLGLCVLISFAAGALLAVSLLDIVPETIELIGWTGALLSLLSGYALFYFVTKFIFHICPACAATHTEINFKAITIAMVVALSIHSFMDGLAIYSGYLTQSSIGVLIFIAVAYHKLPEGMALTLVARGSGLGRAKAFAICIGLELCTTLAGGLIGFLVMIPESSKWIGYILGHVGGGFIYLVIHALLSEVVKHHPRSTILAALVGGSSIAALGLLIRIH
jgi:zinc transporter ZupT